MLVVLAQPRDIALETVTVCWAITPGIMITLEMSGRNMPIMLAQRSQMLGVCTTCTAMSGSGVSCRLGLAQASLRVETQSNLRKSSC